jgi:protein-S-isoprenylcysteine O-methyltransferase Ste14
MLSQAGEVLLNGWIATWPTKLFALVWLMWVLSWITASFWSGRTKTHVPTLNSLAYRLPILLGAILLSPWGAGGFWEKPLYNLGDGGALMLAAVMLSGLLFTWWGRIHLGRLWSNAITHKENHRIIESGPYRLVRHPIYSGLILAILATGAAVATLASFLGALLISFGEWQKARMEEKFLSTELDPQAYDSYRRRVPMIVPFARF